MNRSALFALVVVPALALAQAPAAPAAPKSKAAGKTAAKPSSAKWTDAAREGKELYGTIRTSLGDIGIKLFTRDAPKTVENFVGLASGEKEWIHPVSKEVQKKALYDGVVFHRVIPNFMIQGGDPLGEGFGGPGYKFEDEFSGKHGFSKPGILAMANAGPNTNGSQFFITVAPTPHLNNHHTIFGEVVSGYDVVEKIAATRRNPMNDKPVTPVVIKRIEISDKAPAGAPKADAPTMDKAQEKPKK